MFLIDCDLDCRLTCHPLDHDINVRNVSKDFQDFLHTRVDGWVFVSRFHIPKNFYPSVKEVLVSAD